MLFVASNSLGEKCPYSELFWSAFSSIRTELREIRCISPYSVRMRENMDQNNSKYGLFLRCGSLIYWFPLLALIKDIIISLLSWRIQIPGGLLKGSSLILRKQHFHKKNFCSKKSKTRFWVVKYSVVYN